MSAVKPGKISLALGAAKKQPVPTNGVKRSHAALHDHDDEQVEHGKAQRVSHFDVSAGGAIDDSRPRVEERPLVIVPQLNRDWREASQRSRQHRRGLPGPAQNGNREAEIAAREAAAKPIFGLNVRKRDAEEQESATNGHSNDEPSDNTQYAPANAEAEARQRTDDEIAMDALLGRNTQPDLVVQAMTEDEAFERDYHEAPDMASLDDYARVPVEQFGAALLRGLGWKEGEGIGSDRGKKVQKTKVPERRPALLGIGAKEEAAVAQELGTWGKAAKDRKGPQQIYNPVLLRDKQTGELFTEEELQKKRERDERQKYELEFDEKERKRDKERRRRGDSRERDSDRREKDRRSGKEDSRNRDYRDSDGDRHRSKRDDSDDEYYRRKREKERRYRDQDHDGKDRDRDRDRSSRYDSERHRHRDREREHDRDRRR